MPFAMIDLEWLDGSEYHRFLLWIVKNMSGTDGWNGLLAGQVRFSRRQVELELGATRHQATLWTQKAVADGLLVATKSHRNHKGLGEIYTTGGKLWASRKSDRPTTDQQPTV